MCASQEACKMKSKEGTKWIHANQWQNGKRQLAQEAALKNRKAQREIMKSQIDLSVWSTYCCFFFGLFPSGQKKCMTGGKTSAGNAKATFHILPSIWASVCLCLLVCLPTQVSVPVYRFSKHINQGEKWGRRQSTAAVAEAAAEWHKKQQQEQEQPQE